MSPIASQFLKLCFFFLTFCSIFSFLLLPKIKKKEEKNEKNRKARYYTIQATGNLNKGKETQTGKRSGKGQGQSRVRGFKIEQNIFMARKGQKIK